jgi:hypothetical protein
MNELRAGRALEVAGVILIPVERISITAQQEGGHVWLQANKEVAAVVVCEAQAVRLLDVSGETLSLDEWLGQVAGLEESLQACRSG